MSHVSIEAKEFISKLLDYDPERRPSAQVAINDKWMKTYNEENEFQESITEALL